MGMPEYMVQEKDKMKESPFWRNLNERGTVKLDQWCFQALEGSQYLKIGYRRGPNGWEEESGKGEGKKMRKGSINLFLKNLDDDKCCNSDKEQAWWFIAHVKAAISAITQA